MPVCWQRHQLQRGPNGHSSLVLYPALFPDLDGEASFNYDGSCTDRASQVLPLPTPPPEALVPPFGIGGDGLEIGSDEYKLATRLESAEALDDVNAQIISIVTEFAKSHDSPTSDVSDVFRCSYKRSRQSKCRQSGKRAWSFVQANSTSWASARDYLSSAVPEDCDFFAGQ